jgi:hypothetical protein
MGCENFANVVKFLSLLIVKRRTVDKTAGRQSPFTAFWLVLHRERLSHSYSLLMMKRDYARRPSRTWRENFKWNQTAGDGSGSGGSLMN